MLSGKVAVVTGASRGVGKGVALGLGEAGAIVYVTGRTLEEAKGPLPGTLRETAAQVTALGGQGISVRCDHRNDAEVAEVFRRVEREQGRLDVLVNNVFSVPDGKLFDIPFWEQPISIWDELHGVGLRSHYVASVFAAPLMVRQRSGLIANISSFGAARFALNVAYGVGKKAVDRLAADMAHDLAPHNVAAVSLWPGIVKTERLLLKVGELPYDPTHGESAQFTGRAVAALAADPEVMKRTGQRWVVAELAEAYGFTDVDGGRPRSLRRKD